MKRKISLCMIVKDEEKLLSKCLESVKKVVDETVVVDTGSDDTTVSIARSFGAKIFYHVWDDNFSVPRNISLEHASGEWILILDADERLEEKSKPALRALTQNEDICGYYARIQLHPEWSEMRSLRLFRNHPTLRFRGIFHEELTVPDDSYDKIVPSQIKIIHHPYTEEDLKIKHTRNIRLLQKHIALYPDDIYQILDHTRLYLETERLSEAEKLLERVSFLLPQREKQGSTFKAELNQGFYYFYKIGLMCKQNRKIRNILAVCEKALSVLPSCPVFLYEAASIHYKLQDYDKVIRYFQKCIELGKNEEIDITITYPKNIVGVKALTGLGHCFFKKRCYEQAEQYFQESYGIEKDEKIKTMFLSARFLLEKKQRQ